VLLGFCLGRVQGGISLRGCWYIRREGPFAREASEESDWRKEREVILGALHEYVSSVFVFGDVVLNCRCTVRVVVPS